MTSVKCPECGLIYWNTSVNCKRCGLPTAGHPENGPDPASFAVNEKFYPDTFEEEQLLHKLGRDAKLFYLIGGLQIGLWFFIGSLLIVDGIFNIGLALTAHKFKSRVAAILLMLLTMLSVLFGIIAFATGALHFNLLAPLILIGRMVASIRMVITTFKLNSRVEVDVTRMMPPLPPRFEVEDNGPPEELPMLAG